MKVLHLTVSKPLAKLLTKAHWASSAGTLNYSTTPPLAVSYLWRGHKCVSFWIGIIATREIPVVGRNYCIFLSFLDVLPVKEANMPIRSKWNTASRCLTARISQLGSGSNHYLRNMSWCLGMFSSLKHRPKMNECKPKSDTDSCSSFHSPCCSLLNCLNDNQLSTLPLDNPVSHN